MLKAIIFDMDDTLLDWETREMDWFDYDRIHLRKVYDYASTLHTLPDFDAFMEMNQAITIETWTDGGRTLEAPHLGQVMAETLQKSGVPREKIDIRACLEAYDWQGLPGVLPFPEVPDVLHTLRQHDIRLGIITNAYQPMWMRDRELTILGLDPDLFDCRTSSADHGNLKPHPAVFEHTLRDLNAAASEAVFVGDNLEADIGGAQGVGMKGILRTSNETPFPGSIQPDAAIDTLNELFPLLDRWYPGWQNGN